MTRRHVMRTWKAVSMTLAVVAACGGGTDTRRNGVVSDPIRFEHRLEIGRRESPSRRPLHQGDPVTNGDRIQAFVNPAQVVYLYLGYCDGREFKLFPPPQSPAVRAEAKQETKIPAGGAAYEINSDAKSEVLYLILSTEELTPASPDLAVKLATSGEPVDGDCVGPPIDDHGKPIPPEAPVKARPADSGIEVVRYTFKHPASAAPPGKARTP